MSDPTPRSSATPSPLTTLVYALAALPLAASVPPFFLQIAPQRLEAPEVAAVAVIAVLIALRLLDAVAVLVAGAWSDTVPLAARRRGGWWAGAGLTLAGLAPLLLLKPGTSLLPLLLGGTLTTLGWVLMRVSHLAWGAELAAGYHDRTRLFTAAQLATLLGIGLGLGAPLLAVEVGAARLDALAALYLLLVGVTALAALAILALPDRQPAAPPGGFGVIARRLGGLRAWRRLLGAHTANVAANTLAAALLLPIAAGIVGDASAAPTALAAYLLAALIGLPLGAALALRYSKHAMWCAALVLAAAVLIWIPLLGPGHTLPLLILAALLGLTGGLDWALSAAIQADIPDVEAAHTGAPRTGLHFAVWSLAGRVGFTLAGAAALLTVALAPPNPAPGTGEVSTLLLVAGIAPAALKLAAMGLMWDFPVDEIRHEALQRRIAERRAADDATAG
ncbi:MULTISPECIES: MFS transporter [unclassified Halorhodospira]|uniref:MFS transporter n=1 Tax=unclassified Halorhodospira TaxID=2626748 RepID=UPI001EE79894|nr:MULTISPECIES: MFS transporter [unclassified Halorhodospira]MCG5540312.1 MFS transporter [Halorhodospira sp. M39old]MCG5545850.1 MFS transporter [Halorhodospira sp. M38]